MNLPIRVLPVVESWDCHGCSACCRGTTVVLDHEDLVQLESQNWEADDSLPRRRVVVREGLLGGRKVLGKKPDGSCVFLTSEGRCRIHEKFGEQSKPSVCRTYPFHIVTLQKHQYLTLRFGCPSATQGKGEPVEKKLPKLRKSRLLDRFAKSQTIVPRITRAHKPNWRQFSHVAEVLRRLTCDDRLPLVRRVAHGLRFCNLLNRLKINQANENGFRELIQLVEDEAAESVGEVFRDRVAPSTWSETLMRQSGVHFIRSHPSAPIAFSLISRFRLVLSSVRFMVGRGVVPVIHPDLAEATFEQAQAPLGPLPDELLAPLNRYFESTATSLHYTLHGKSLISSYRTFAYSLPMALWLLRLLTPDREPKVDDIVSIISALDRGQGATTISVVADLLGEMGALESIVAWYAR